MGVKKSLGEFGSRFAFEFLLETMRGAVIQGLKKYLSSITAEDIPAMVREGKFPPPEHLDLSTVGDNIEHTKRISLLRLMEFIAEARPDLAMALQNMGDAGAEYLVKLRLHILQGIEQAEFKPEENVVLAHCDKCGKKWPVKKDEASSIAKCPFCGEREGEPKEPPAENE